MPLPVAGSKRCNALDREAGFDAGYPTIVGNSGERPDRERQYVGTLLSKRIDGLIFAPRREPGARAAQGADPDRCHRPR
jgi:DNA-binding LacI/PurR family transcriptional regulator